MVLDDLRSVEHGLFGIIPPSISIPVFSLALVRVLFYLRDPQNGTFELLHLADGVRRLPAWQSGAIKGLHTADGSALGDF
jgi:hypothetical protein